jgi:hypothetical protein
MKFIKTIPAVSLVSLSLAAPANRLRQSVTERTTGSAAGEGKSDILGRSLVLGKSCPILRRPITMGH